MKERQEKQRKVCFVTLDIQVFTHIRNSPYRWLMAFDLLLRAEHFFPCTMLNGQHFQSIAEPGAKAA